MKLFIGCGKDKHKYGFLLGIMEPHFDRYKPLCSNLSVIQDCWSILLNMLIFVGLFVTYPNKDSKSVSKLIFEIQIGLFFFINTVSAIYTLIDTKFLTRFQKASKWLPFMAFLWILYWGKYAVWYYRPEWRDLQLDYGWIFDLSIVFFHFTFFLAVWRKKEPAVRTNN